MDYYNIFSCNHPSELGELGARITAFIQKLQSTITIKSITTNMVGTDKAFTYTVAIHYFNIDKEQSDE